MFDVLRQPSLCRQRSRRRSATRARPGEHHGTAGCAATTPTRAAASERPRRANHCATQSWT
eukprot:1707648-Pleurochrysis_carterae.AAC.1